MMREENMKKMITAEEFDRRFDAGEDISEWVDWSTARRPGLEKKRVYLSLPAWAVKSLDKQAKSQGVPRSSLINKMISKNLESAS